MAKLCSFIQLGLFDDANVSLINNFLLLSYNEHYRLFSEHHLSMYADYQTIKRSVYNMFKNYRNEKL